LNSKGKLFVIKSAPSLKVFTHFLRSSRVIASKAGNGRKENRKGGNSTKFLKSIIENNLNL
jgi:hypothetical protein